MKTIFLEGEITTDTAKQFRAQLPTSGEPVVLDIFSEGGSVVAALRICDVIKSYAGKVTARVSSAFSAATMVSSACDEVQITELGSMMIHAPYFEAEGVSSSEKGFLESLRARMETIYSEKTRKPLAMVSKWLDGEVFFDAQTAIAAGLADRLCYEPMAHVSTAQAVGPTIAWKRAVSARTSLGMDSLRAKLEVDRVYPGLRQRMIQEENSRR